MRAVHWRWSLLSFLLGLSIAPATMRAQTIFEAAAGGDPDRVRAMLADDPALVHAVDGEQRTPLHYAAHEGGVPIGALLLDRGAEVAAALRGHAGAR